MNFKMPDTLDGLSIEDLNDLHAKALAESQDLTKIADDEVTDEQLDELEALSGHLTKIAEARTSLEEAAAARAERIAAAKSAVEAQKPVDKEPEPDEDPEPENETPEEPVEETLPEAPEDVVIPDDAADLIEEKEKEPVAHKSVAKVAAHAAPAEDVTPDGDAAEPQVTIVAAAGVPSFQPKQELADLDEVAQAFLSRTRGLKTTSDRVGKSPIPLGPRAFSDNVQRFGIAQIQKPDFEFSTGMDEPVEKQYETLMAAAKESRLPGGSLTAAGGWCAPSETLYDSFAALENGSAALYSLPEIGAKRGGIRYTRGPQLADVMNEDGSFGFIQTEAQAEAGQVKPLLSIECPEWDEVRMDAVGYGITVPILTNKAYPELVRRYIALAATAHRLRMNADRIARVQTFLGAAINHAEIGAATSDILDALVIQATRLRFQFTMDPEATIEVVLPAWAKEFIRADLSRRNGVDLLNVSDAQINSYFTTRHLAVQYIRGYQDWTGPTTGTWTRFPTTLEAFLYPAGTFVALAEDVISLDGIYDTDGLTHNTYTGVFFEEGTAVASLSGAGVRVAIDITPEGLSGAAIVGSTTEPSGE